MKAKSFAKSGAGAVPMVMPDDCLYTTPPNCTNPSSNTKFIHSHKYEFFIIYVVAIPTEPLLCQVFKSNSSVSGRWRRISGSNHFVARPLS